MVYCGGKYYVVLHMERQVAAVLTTMKIWSLLYHVVIVDHWYKKTGTNYSKHW